MDARVVGVVVAFGMALAAGITFGWWQGPASSQVAAVSSMSGSAVDSADGEPSGVAPAAVVTEQPYAGKAFGVGDSVLAGAAPCLNERRIKVDAHQSRQIADGVDVLIQKGRHLPPRVLVHLGTNGGATADDLDAIMKVLGPSRLVVWSTIQLPDDPSRYTFEASTNAAIAALPLRYDNVRVFDWNAVSSQQPSWIYPEGVHVTEEGCQGYAALVDGLLRAPSPFGNGD